MTNFKEISAKELQNSPFKLIGQDWMLITAENEGLTNAMTASWGGLGVMWGKNVAFIVVRPQRYTKELLDKSEKFSLTFFDETYKKTLNYFGTVSGRDEDKIATSGLSLKLNDNIPYFEEAKLCLLCKKLFRQNFSKESFIDSKLINIWYPKSDFHYLYIAEIEKILIKD